MGVEIKDGITFIDSLRALPRETDWVEFKTSNFHPDNIGKYVSSLANSAIIHEKDEAYLIFGIRDEDHAVVGTAVDLAAEKQGSEPFLLWLSKYLSPNIYVHQQRIDYYGKPVEVICVKPPYQQPVRFKGRAYVRVAGSQQELTSHPDLERTIWSVTSRFSFEMSVTEPNVTWKYIEESYDWAKMLELLGKQYDTKEGAVGHLESLELLRPNLQGRYDVRALAGLTCAKRMDAVSLLRGKTVRVIIYKKTDKLDAGSDHEGKRGYTTSFANLMKFLMERVPHSEVMKHGIRTTEYMIPEPTVREFVANAIIQVRTERLHEQLVAALPLRPQ